MTIIEITSEEQFNHALDTLDGLGVVLFTAPSWCAPCRAFEPQFNSLQQFTTATLVRVDIDDNPWATQSEDIASVPFIKLYNGQDYLRRLNPAKADVFADSITE